MEKKKKRYAWEAAGLILILIAIIAAVGIGAYLTAGDEAPNEFTIRPNTIEIHEDFDPPDEGTHVTKKVQIENTGETPSFVRVQLRFSDWDIGNDSTLLYQSLKTASNPDGMWELGADGYYYYRDVVDPDDMTEVLINGIELGENIEDIEGYLDVYVYAESIAATLYLDEDGEMKSPTSYQTAWLDYDANRG